MKETRKVPFDTVNGTKMVAHRGCSGLETENTVAAFVAAANRSYYGIETDVHVTKDGKFVCIHDDATGRVCDKTIGVEESSFDELRALKIKNKNGEFDRADLVIPTLADYITTCRDYGKRAVLELKREMTPEVVKGIVEEIAALDYADGVTYISFAFQNLVYVRENNPNAKVQFLTGDDIDDGLIEKLVAHKFDLDIYYQRITSSEQVKKLHDNGIEVNVWTVDDPYVATLLAGFGVDYITSNICE